MTWSDFEEYAAFTQDFLDAVRVARRAGLSADVAVGRLGGLQQQYPDYDLNAGRQKRRGHLHGAAALEPVS